MSFEQNYSILLMLLKQVDVKFTELKGLKMRLFPHLQQPLNVVSVKVSRYIELIEKDLMKKPQISNNPEEDNIEFLWGNSEILVDACKAIIVDRNRTSKLLKEIIQDALVNFHYAVQVEGETDYKYMNCNLADANYYVKSFALLGKKSIIINLNNIEDGINSDQMV